MRKRILSLIWVLALLSIIVLSVSAQEVPDFEKRGSISLTMTYQGQPIAGGSLTLYRVADVVSDDGDYFFAYTADFAECPIPVTELDSTELPAALETIAGEKNLTGVTQELDAKGQTVFSDLEIGLYLLVQDTPAPGYQKIQPFLVSVPYYDGETYIYDVDTVPKNIPEPETEPTEPTTEPSEPTEPTEPELPQTGQTNWPIPVMAVMGMLLITAGFCLRTHEKKKHDEA